MHKMYNYTAISSDFSHRLRLDQLCNQTTHFDWTKTYPAYLLKLSIESAEMTDSGKLFGIFKIRTVKEYSVFLKS